VPRKRWILAGVLAVIVLGLAGGAWAMRDQVAYARIATGYAAKQTCSCLNVSGREMESCMADFPEDARQQMSVVQSGDSVTASVLFGAISAEAVFEPEYGCRMVN
jgi:hypothetical protein